MSTIPPPTISRGDLTLQPSYFTSSLFVNPLREDIAHLVQLFTEKYLASDLSQPFSLFKQIWKEQGWNWLHLKVFDARARDKFVAVTLRLFAELFQENTDPLGMTVSLFGMYTFFSTQPSTSAPSMHGVQQVPLPINSYRTMLSLPSSLVEAHLLPLRPYATHVLSNLLDAQIFHILPDASLRPQDPSNIPREYFVEDEADPAAILGQSLEASAMEDGATRPKKKGRPGKRDKMKRAKDAVTALDKWLDKNTYTYSVESVAGPSSMPPGGTLTKTTHSLISHPPTASRTIYTMQKGELLQAVNLSSTPVLALGHTGLNTEGITPVIDPVLMAAAANTSPGRAALARANEAVFTRLKKIDEMAAEQGLEVGGEGGDMTGLRRVERAVQEFREGKSRGGILSLLEGAGIESPEDGSEAQQEG